MAKKPRNEPIAAPMFKRGERVSYRDHHNRAQDGVVLDIEAHWPNWGGMYIAYTVSHPTYRDRRMYIGEDKLHPLT